MKYMNIFKKFTRFELMLWLVSLFTITVFYVFARQRDPYILIGSLIGITALIFVAKGNVIGQMLTVVFSLFYAMISYKFHYYGEMITYLGMTAPIALLSTISWLRNPYEKGKSEVKIENLSKSKITLLAGLTFVVTFIFYFILKYYETTNLIVSTVSIATSFVASFLMFFRSPYYATAYACNDVVLIIMWILATIENNSYLPMIMCFVIFFINDIYGFVNWKRMKKKQIYAQELESTVYV